MSRVPDEVGLVSIIGWWTLSLRMAGSASLSSSAVLTGAVMHAGAMRRSRRSWSRDAKRRIVDETFRPGASVADVARRHGLNANLVFNWRKASWATGDQPRRLNLRR